MGCVCHGFYYELVEKNHPPRGINSDSMALSARYHDLLSCKPTSKPWCSCFHQASLTIVMRGGNLFQINTCSLAPQTPLPLPLNFCINQVMTYAEICWYAEICDRNLLPDFVCRNKLVCWNLGYESTSRFRIILLVLEARVFYGKQFC